MIRSCIDPFSMTPSSLVLSAGEPRRGRDPGQRLRVQFHGGGGCRAGDAGGRCLPGPVPRGDGRAQEKQAEPAGPHAGRQVGCREGLQPREERQRASKGLTHSRTSHNAFL